jgi:hypothetical protein
MMEVYGWSRGWHMDECFYFHMDKVQVPFQKHV